MQGEFKPIEILAPFVNWQKWQEWQLCDELGSIRLDSRAYTAVTEKAVIKDMNGVMGCGQCISCELRAKLF